MKTYPKLMTTALLAAACCFFLVSMFREPMTMSRAAISKAQKISISRCK